MDHRRQSLFDLYNKDRVCRESSERSPPSGSLVAATEKYLTTTPHHKKFESKDINNAIEQSVEQYVNWNPELGAVAFLGLEGYGLNLIDEPYLMEYKTIKLFNGFIQVRIKPYLPTFEYILQRYGYASKHRGLYMLERELSREILVQLCFDCFLAYVECEIMKAVCDQVCPHNYCIKDVLRGRKEREGDATTCALWVKANCKPSDQMSPKLWHNESRTSNKPEPISLITNYRFNEVDDAENLGLIEPPPLDLTNESFPSDELYGAGNRHILPAKPRVSAGKKDKELPESRADDWMVVNNDTVKRRLDYRTKVDGPRSDFIGHCSQQLSEELEADMLMPLKVEMPPLPMPPLPDNEMLDLSTDGPGDIQQVCFKERPTIAGTSFGKTLSTFGVPSSSPGSSVNLGKSTAGSSLTARTSVIPAVKPKYSVATSLSSDPIVDPWTTRGLAEQRSPGKAIIPQRSLPGYADAKVKHSVTTGYTESRTVPSGLGSVDTTALGSQRAAVGSPGTPGSAKKQFDYWQCLRCSAFNHTGSRVCEKCDSVSPASNASQAKHVNCERCTFLNEPGSTICEVCNYNFT